MMKPVGRLESLIKSEVRRHLDKTDSVHACYIPGQPGWPDRIAVMPIRITKAMVGKKVGIFVGIECKRTRATRTPIQRTIAQRIRAAGGIAIRVSSWSQVERFRRLLDKRFFSIDQ